jgi:pSer/pThr/pTyr-binding forkhead associated (FHA) protein
MILAYKNKEGKDTMIRMRSISMAPPVTLGRGDKATIQLEDELCSRIHSAIRYWDDIFIIRDCKSRNGTFVNGQQIKVAQLEPGDVIKIGNSELTVMASSGSATEVTMQP